MSLSMVMKLTFLAAAAADSGLHGFLGSRRMAAATMCETGTTTKRSSANLATFVGDLYDKITKGKSCASTGILTRAKLEEAIKSGEFDMFANVGNSDDMNEREVAAFFANVFQETGELCATIESACNKDTPDAFCKTDYQKVFWPANADDADDTVYYFGRGALQTSYPGNYALFLNFWHGESYTAYNLPKAKVEALGTDGKIAWASVLYFWTSAGWNKPSCSQVMQCDSSVDTSTPSGLKFGFGWTINIINGEKECGKVSTKAANRATYFSKAQTAAGLIKIADDLTSCKDMGIYA
jgi:hypothetical protein